MRRLYRLDPAAFVRRYLSPTDVDRAEGGVHASHPVSGAAVKASIAGTPRVIQAMWVARTQPRE